MDEHLQAILYGPDLLSDFGDFNRDQFENDDPSNATCGAKTEKIDLTEAKSAFITGANYWFYIPNRSNDGTPDKNIVTINYQTETDEYYIFSNSPIKLESDILVSDSNKNDKIFKLKVKGNDVYVLRKINGIEKYIFGNSVEKPKHERQDINNSYKLPENCKNIDEYIMVQTAILVRKTLHKKDLKDGKLEEKLKILFLFSNLDNLKLSYHYWMGESLENVLNLKENELLTQKKINEIFSQFTLSDSTNNIRCKRGERYGIFDTKSRSIHRGKLNNGLSFYDITKVNEKNWYIFIDLSQMKSGEIEKYLKGQEDPSILVKLNRCKKLYQHKKVYYVDSEYINYDSHQNIIFNLDLGVPTSDLKRLYQITQQGGIEEKSIYNIIEPSLEFKVVQLALLLKPENKEKNKEKTRLFASLLFWLNLCVDDIESNDFGQCYQKIVGSDIKNDISTLFQEKTTDILKNYLTEFIDYTKSKKPIPLSMKLCLESGAISEDVGILKKYTKLKASLMKILGVEYDASWIDLEIDQAISDLELSKDTSTFSLEAKVIIKTINEWLVKDRKGNNLYYKIAKNIYAEKYTELSKEIDSNFRWIEKLFNEYVNGKDQVKAMLIHIAASQGMLNLTCTVKYDQSYPAYELKESSFNELMKITNGDLMSIKHLHCRNEGDFKTWIEKRLRKEDHDKVDKINLRCMPLAASCKLLNGKYEDIDKYILELCSIFGKKSEVEKKMKDSIKVNFEFIIPTKHNYKYGIDTLDKVVDLYKKAQKDSNSAESAQAMVLFIRNLADFPSTEMPKNSFLLEFLEIAREQLEPVQGSGLGKELKEYLHYRICYHDNQQDESWRLRTLIPLLRIRSKDYFMTQILEKKLIKLLKKKIGKYFSDGTGKLIKKIYYEIFNTLSFYKNGLEPLKYIEEYSESFFWDSGGNLDVNNMILLGLPVCYETQNELDNMSNQFEKYRKDKEEDQLIELQKQDFKNEMHSILKEKKEKNGIETHNHIRFKMGSDDHKKYIISVSGARQDPLTFHISRLIFNKSLVVQSYIYCNFTLTELFTGCFKTLKQKQIKLNSLVDIKRFGVAGTIDTRNDINIQLVEPLEYLLRNNGAVSGKFPHSKENDLSLSVMCKLIEPNQYGEAREAIEEEVKKCEISSFDHQKFSKIYIPQVNQKSETNNNSFNMLLKDFQLTENSFEVRVKSIIAKMQMQMDLEKYDPRFFLLDLYEVKTKFKKEEFEHIVEKVPKLFSKNVLAGNWRKRYLLLANHVRNRRGAIGIFNNKITLNDLNLEDLLNIGKSAVLSRGEAEVRYADRLVEILPKEDLKTFYKNDAGRYHLRPDLDRWFRKLGRCYRDIRSKLDERYAHFILEDAFRKQGDGGEGQSFDAFLTEIRSALLLQAQVRIKRLQHLNSTKTMTNVASVAMSHNNLGLFIHTLSKLGEKKDLVEVKDFIKLYEELKVSTDKWSQAFQEAQNETKEFRNLIVGVVFAPLAITLTILSSGICLPFIIIATVGIQAIKSGVKSYIEYEFSRRGERSYWAIFRDFLMEATSKVIATVLIFNLDENEKKLIAIEEPPTGYWELCLEDVKINSFKLGKTIVNGIFKEDEAKVEKKKENDDPSVNGGDLVKLFEGACEQLKNNGKTDTQVKEILGEAIERECQKNNRWGTEEGYGSDTEQLINLLPVMTTKSMSDIGTSMNS